ncbi:MAG: hypothetical protein IPP53_03965 [Bacteroidetes bacterium]|nr:hypothetical protein [Bacteroidota bacterium]
MLTPSAPSGVTFNWYDAASNGNLLFSGSTFTTPTLNSNTTYYVESENGSGCKSTRTSVTVTIDAAPQVQQSVARVFAVDKRLCLHQVLHQVLRSIGTMLHRMAIYCLVVLRLQHQH